MAALRAAIFIIRSEFSNMFLLHLDKKGMQIVLNPSPFDEIITECDLSKVSIILINEIEGYQMTGREDPEEMQRRPCGLFNVIFSIHFLPVLRIGRCLQN